MTNMQRRTFLVGAGITTLASSHLVSARSKSSPGPVQLTGNGEWMYAVVPDWGALPAGTIFGGTHGAIAQDKSGKIYVSTQSDTGVLVYNPDGHLLKRIATAYPEVHSLVFATEGAEEFIYATVQKGTPKENWLFLKMKTDGSVVMKITAPPEAGFKSPNEWRITAALPTPDGSIFIANGYGDSRIFRFDKNGNYKASYSGKGDGEGQLNCSHGISLDSRYDQPLLLVCDRENRRLCHFDLDGRYVRTVTQHLRRPCQVSFHRDYAFVSELEGRATILDRDNVPVAFIGDNPQKAQWAKYDLDPHAMSAAVFSAAHGCFIDSHANIFVSDWNQVGRLTKLSRV
ncbi:MAG TPA: 6-bladed beta-propeller [Candidatus Sulfotelmatobacter sp.]|nr:6-bladed beta-propeller [Candidatus Sulfotelmatobacter sp.]